MLDILREFKHVFEEKKTSLRRSTELVQTVPNVVVVLNNTQHLIETLIRLFSDEKSEQLPTTITSPIRTWIQDTRHLFHLIEDNPATLPSNGQKIFRNLEELYAHCLQYGLVAFGFPIKEITQTFQNYVNKFNDIDVQVENLASEVNSRKKTFEEALQEISDRARSTEEGLRQKVSECTTTFDNESDRILAELKQIAENYKNEVQDKRGHIDNAVRDYTSRFQSTEETLRQKADQFTHTIKQQADRITSDLEQIAKQYKNDIAGKHAAVTDVIEHFTTTLQNNESDLRQKAEQSTQAISEETGRISSELQQIAERYKSDVDGKYGWLDQIVEQFTRTLRSHEDNLRQHADQSTETIAQETDRITTELQQIAEQYKGQVSEQGGRIDAVIEEFSSALRQTEDELKSQAAHSSETLTHETERIKAELEQIAQQYQNDVAGKNSYIDEFVEQFIHALKSREDELRQNAEDAVRTMTQESQRITTEIRQIADQYKSDVDDRYGQLDQIVQDFNAAVRNREDELKNQAARSAEAVTQETDRLKADLTQIAEEYKNDLAAKNTHIDEFIENFLNTLKTRDDGLRQKSDEAARTIADETARIRAELDQTADRFKSDIDGRGDQIDAIIQDFRNSLHTTEDGLKTHADQCTASFDEKAADILADITRIADNYRSEIDARIGNVEDILARIHDLGDQARERLASCDDVLSHITAAREQSRQIVGELSDVKSAAESEQNKTRDLVEQINRQLHTATGLNARIEVAGNSAEHYLENIKQKEGHIHAFHQAIEDHKQELQDLKAKADADYEVAREQFQATLDACKAETEEIIQTNKASQEEIRELLNTSAGIGLFGVFKQRQEFLARARNFWRLAAIGSALVFAISLFLLLWNLSTQTEAVYYVRLAIIIPLAFLMFFTASQYRKERQAEEEYAFKSAISFSLEPYRDLLERMQAGGELETEFVKKLMEDVFDNPNKRLYKK